MATFTISHMYTGKSQDATLIRETKCYYTIQVNRYYSNGGALVKRFHKATMRDEVSALYLFVNVDECAELLKTDEAVEVIEKSTQEIANLYSRLAKGLSAKKALQDAPAKHVAYSFDKPAKKETVELSPKFKHDIAEGKKIIAKTRITLGLNKPAQAQPVYTLYSVIKCALQDSNMEYNDSVIDLYKFQIASLQFNDLALEDVNKELGLDCDVLEAAWNFVVSYDGVA